MHEKKKHRFVFECTYVDWRKDQWKYETWVRDNYQYRTVPIVYTKTKFIFGVCIQNSMKQCLNNLLFSFIIQNKKNSWLNIYFYSMKNSLSLYHGWFVSDSCSLDLHLPHQTPIIPSVSAAMVSNNSFMSESVTLLWVIELCHDSTTKNADNYKHLLNV